MSTLRLFSVLMVVGMVLTICLVPANAAANMDRRTVITFSQPIEIPGMVLAAGTYVFITDRADPSIVRIYNSDESNLLASLSTTRAYRLEANDKATVMKSQEPGSPMALSAWYVPGELVGREFIYTSPSEPKAPAPARIAKALPIAGNGALSTTHKTVLELKEAAEVPGMILEPGTYIFKINSLDNHLVQIYNSDGTELLTTLMTVSAYRLDANGTPALFEGRSDGPDALKAWFENGQIVGREFVYGAAATAEGK